MAHNVKNVLVHSCNCHPGRQKNVGLPCASHPSKGVGNRMYISHSTNSADKGMRKKRVPIDMCAVVCAQFFKTALSLLKCSAGKTEERHIWLPFAATKSAVTEMLIGSKNN